MILFVVLLILLFFTNTHKQLEKANYLLDSFINFVS